MHLPVEEDSKYPGIQILHRIKNRGNAKSKKKTGRVKAKKRERVSRKE